MFSSVFSTSLGKPSKSPGSSQVVGNVVIGVFSAKKRNTVLRNVPSPFQLTTNLFFTFSKKILDSVVGQGTLLFK